MRKTFSRSPWLWALSMMLTLSVAMPSITQAKSNAISVQIAPFPVTVNGVELQAARNPYPPIVYHDITYLPLTWDIAQAFRWSIEWDESAGLKIIPGSSGTINEEQIKRLQPQLNANNRMNAAYRAAIPTYPVVLGGIRNSPDGTYAIDSTKEPYPMLEFRDITYFPMTWDMAHERLGLTLQWGDEEGLQIDAPQAPAFSSYEMTEDADYLYLSTLLGRYPDKFKLMVRKTLDQKPTWLSESEFEAWKAAQPSTTRVEEPRNASSGANNAAGAPFRVSGVDVSSSLKKEPKALRYRDLPLDVGNIAGEGSPYQDLSREELQTEGTWYGLGKDRGVLSVKLTFVLPIATIRELPFEALTYFIDGDQATLLEDYRSLTKQVVVNPDGSAWIISNELQGNGRLSQISMNDHTARLGLLQPNGTFTVVNTKFGGEDVNVIGAENTKLISPQEKDGSILIQVFHNPVTPMDLPTWNGTVYRLNTKLESSKLFEYDKGFPYLDMDRTLYWVDPVHNSITNRNSGAVFSIRDYELLEL